MRTVSGRCPRPRTRENEIGSRTRSESDDGRGWTDGPAEEPPDQRHQHLQGKPHPADGEREPLAEDENESVPRPAPYPVWVYTTDPSARKNVPNNT